jgi:hypothetical protein
LKRHIYFTKDEDNNFIEIDEGISDDVIRQYIERRYTGVIIISSFIIGFLLGVIANA